MLQAVETFNESNQDAFAFGDVDYDIEVSLIGDRLWFGIATMINGAPSGLSLALEEVSTVKLSAILARIAHAERLAETFAAIGNGASLLNLSPVDLSVRLRSSDPLLLEKNSRPGGLTSTERIGGYLFDRTGLRVGTHQYGHVLEGVLTVQRSRTS